MPATHTDRALPTDINSLPLISDDECVSRLAAAVKTHDRDLDDDDHLDEVALLIGRLAVPIEI
ncbi:MAG: hypothetical protein CFE29_06640 [Bradyrhizobiaceae bacterium PARB1]|jgi:hypothetical protein|nr:MAG: hypothetical protein CFE29_06640 [Bradyrhizobiaceae bacterium PARB1]